MPGSLSLGPPPYLLTNNARLRHSYQVGRAPWLYARPRFHLAPSSPGFYLYFLIWISWCGFSFCRLQLKSPNIHRCPEVLLIVFKVFVDFLEKSIFETLSLVLKCGTSVQSYPCIVWTWTTTQGNTSDHKLSPGSFHVFNWSHATLIATIQL